jgi:hypothetical protein
VALRNPPKIKDIHTENVIIKNKEQTFSKNVGVGFVMSSYIVVKLLET